MIAYFSLHTWHFIKHTFGTLISLLRQNKKEIKRRQGRLSLSEITT